MVLTADQQGSIREMTDQNGNIVSQYSYDPYGKVTKLQGTMDSDFGYAGMYVHQRSGMNLTLFRAYKPDLGRWISRDPLGERGRVDLDYRRVKQGWPLGVKNLYSSSSLSVIAPSYSSYPSNNVNRYAYVDNDPINSIDPLGLYGVPRTVVKVPIGWVPSETGNGGQFVWPDDTIFAPSGYPDVDNRDKCPLKKEPPEFFPPDPLPPA